MKMAIACWVLGSALAAAESESVPMEAIRNFHTDEVLQPACMRAELRRLKATSDELARGRHPSSAWRVAETMLCGKRLPLHYMSSLISRDEYGIGHDIGPTSTKVPRAEIAPLRGYAYGVELQRQKDDLIYRYNTAGVCSGGFTVRYVQPEWLIVEVGEACD